MQPAILGLIFFLASFAAKAAEPLSVAPRMHHLRATERREWSDFPAKADSEKLEVTFDAPRGNDVEWTLEWRQQDVKQVWRVTLNDGPLAELAPDENDMRVYVAVPSGGIRGGENTLVISQANPAVADDIRVGEIVLHPRPRQQVLSEAHLEIEVKEADTESLVPARLTIVHEHGGLQTTDAVSDDQLAVRPGTIYTASGKARFGLPAGSYTVFAGRGFEYSLASEKITLKAGDTERRTLTIHREVPTEGYVACDTHVHTLTHSGHGDATVEERMITLAAEGIELPIATDHNVHIDHDPVARRMHVRQYFTPVIGNEVTTPAGHFNIFPVAADAEVPDFRQTDWHRTFDAIYRTPGVNVAILNHARDLHSGVRPFGPKLFNDAVGHNVEGWPMRFNAMEVLNSSATQTDILRLFLDWMALLNRGHLVTPVGSSDSHDVTRHFVGQGRTYIRCDDHDVATINVDNAVQSFLEGRVMVSYGLLTELIVAGEYRSGDLVPVSDEEIEVAVRVLGPHWVQAQRVILYANGQPLREIEIASDTPKGLPRGVKWLGKWKLPRPRHDVHLVAIATGPGVTEPYWKTARPYQPMSPDWEPTMIGCSGAVWLDADGDGRPTPAFEYAKRLIATSGGDLPTLLAKLEDYDAAVAAQAADLYQEAEGNLLSDESQQALRAAADEVKAGFGLYLDSWRRTQAARAAE